MRNLQVVLLVLAVISFIVSIFFAGAVMGDIFWRAGMAILLLDLVCIKLWPNKNQPEAGR
jgi:hypothetical protein